MLLPMPPARRGGNQWSGWWLGRSVGATSKGKGVRYATRARDEALEPGNAQVRPERDARRATHLRG